MSRYCRRCAPSVAAVLVAVSLAGTACGHSRTHAAEDGRLPVTASTNVWGSVVRAVGGDQVAVTSIIDNPSGDPHSYEGTPADALAVQDARLAVYNGGGYDQFFRKLADRSPDTPTVVAYDEHDSAHDGARHHDGDNEHVWYDLATVQRVTDQIAERLGQLRPDAKQTFTANARAFHAQLDDLRARLAGIEGQHASDQVIATEPLAQYVLEATNLRDATPSEFAEAVEEESDVSAAALDEVNQLIDANQVRAVLHNLQTATPVTTQVVEHARESGIAVVRMTETLPASDTDYVPWMSKQVNALAGALNSR